jgi:hypothetical protein
MAYPTSTLCKSPKKKKALLFGRIKEELKVML